MNVKFIYICIRREVRDREDFPTIFRTSSELLSWIGRILNHPRVFQFAEHTTVDKTRIIIINIQIEIAKNRMISKGNYFRIH